MLKKRRSQNGRENEAISTVSLRVAVTIEMLHKKKKGEKYPMAFGVLSTFFLDVLRDFTVRLPTGIRCANVMQSINQLISVTERLAENMLLSNKMMARHFVYCLVEEVSTAS